TFFSISIFAFLIFGSNVIIKYFESKPQVTAFFKNEARQDQIDSLEKTLKNTGEVSQMKFVSKKEALEIYKKQNKNDPLLLDLVSADILPSSLEISTYKLDNLADVSSKLKNSSIVSEVIYQKDIIATLNNWTNAIRLIGIILIAVLTFDSIFIM